MKVLYRKYRPTELKDVIGQEQVTAPLAAALKSGRIGHAYLFTGPRGCGKTSVARIFAHAVNGFPYEVEDNYVDILELDAASHTGVDDIRELTEKATIAPTKGKYKVYIIDEVHMLSKSAFNALLKTLEEPPRHVIFIMATTDAYKVPVTITSRSQVFNFSLAAPDVMKKHLSSIAKKEKIDIDGPALDIIVQRGGGSFRDSISLLDQISTIATGKDKIAKKQVEDILGLPEDAEITQLLSLYQQGNAAEITDTLAKILNHGTKPETIAESLISEIIKTPEPKLLSLLSKLPEVKAPFAEAKLLLAFLGDAAKLPDFSMKSVTISAPAPVPATPTAPQPAESTPESTNSQNAPAKSTPKAPPAAPEPPQATNRPEPAPSETDFNWPAFLAEIEEKSTAVAATLKKTSFSLNNNTLKIVTERKIHKTILNSENNLKILRSALPENLALEIYDNTEIPHDSEQFQQISAIMGVVEEVKSSDIPF